ncbi:MAG: hypothetical protein ABJO67_19925 [Pseudoruegeria sp.]
MAKRDAEDSFRLVFEKDLTHFSKKMDHPPNSTTIEIAPLAKVTIPELPQRKYSSMPRKYRSMFTSVASGPNIQLNWIHMMEFFIRYFPTFTAKSRNEGQ